jgi:hypothetical protein
VAASKPELDQASERLQGPLERSPEESRTAIEAASLQHALGAHGQCGPRPVARDVADDARPLRSRLRAADAPRAWPRDAGPQIRNGWLGISEIVSGLLIVVLALAGMARGRPVVAVGRRRPRALGDVRAARVLDDERGRLRHRHAGRHAGGRLRGDDPADAGISHRALASDDDRPLGWSYSPSSFTQRIPIVALAFVGLFVSRYLAAFQMGHIDGLWDPFFGPGNAPVPMAARRS